MWRSAIARSTGLVLSLVLLALMLHGCTSDSTPNTPGAGVAYVGMPAFYPAAGTYAQPIDVQLLCATKDAVVYYTTDGTTPSATNGHTYRSRIHLETTTTIRTVGCVGGMLDSPYATATYTLDTAANHVNVPPMLANLSIVGTLHEKQQSTLTVSCLASDADGTAQTVKVDLSPLGGSASQALTGDSLGRWVWSGPVFPPTMGAKMLTFTATDNSNSSVMLSTGVGVLPALSEGEQQWKANIGAPAESSPAIGHDGTIYIGSTDRMLYAINPDGTRKWLFEAKGPIYSSPAIGADGTIYVGSADTNLYAVNPNGTEQWHFTTAYAVHGSPAIDKNGNVYVGSWDCKLYALTGTGGLRWTFTTPRSLYSSPAIWYGRSAGEMTIYVGCADGCLYAIKEDGSLRWKVSLGGQIDSSPALAPDGSVYVGSTSGAVFAVNASGTIRWQFVTGGSVRSSPAIGPDGTIYVGSDDKRLYAITPLGAQKWAYASNNAISSSPAITADGTVCVGSTDGNVCGIWPSGDLRWLYAADAPVVSSPSIGADGTVYIGLGDGNLCAIRGLSGLATSGWPMFRSGQTHNGELAIPASVNAPPEISDVLGVDFFVHGVTPLTPATPREGASVDAKPYCQASDSDGTVVSVKADLSQIGGPAWVDLVRNGASWETLTNVVPPRGGSAAVVFMAVDNGGAIGMRTQLLTIQANDPPQIDNLSVVPNVIPLGQATDVVVTCTATDDVKVMSVTADMTVLGGQRYTPLTPKGNNQYSWSGKITGFGAGFWNITLTATDDRGQTATAPATFLVYDPTGGGGKPGTLKWKFDTTRWVDSSPSIDSSGTIYVGCDDRSLYAIDANGKEKWHFQTNGSVETGPAIGSDGTVYFGSRDKNVYAVDSTGKVKWVFATGGEVISSPAIYPDAGGSETIYIGSNDYNLYAIKAVDGKAKWAKPAVTKGAVRSSPAINNSGTIIYVGSDDGNVYAFNASNGTQLGKFAAGDSANPVFGTPAITSMVNGTDMIFVGCANGTFYALSWNLQLLWKQTLGGKIFSSATVGPNSSNGDTMVCVGCDDGLLYAFSVNATQHTQVWTYKAGGAIRSSPVIGTDKTIYFGSYDGYVYALTSTGTLVWKYQLDNYGSVFSSPAIGGAGVVYIGARSRLVDPRWEEYWPEEWDIYSSNTGGGLYAIYSSSSSRSPWLMFRSGIFRRG